MSDAIPFPEFGATSIAVGAGYLDLAEPRADQVALGDIADALSKLARFTGQGRGAVSIARHSVNCYREAVARGLPVEVCRLALMHDATEAYVGDVSRPLKDMMPGYRRIEARVWRAICDRFDLAVALPSIVKEIDNLALITEARALFPHHAPFPGFPEPGFSHDGAVVTRGAGNDAEDFLRCAAAAGIR